MNIMNTVELKNKHLGCSACQFTSIPIPLIICSFAPGPIATLPGSRNTVALMSAGYSIPPTFSSSLLLAPLLQMANTLRSSLLLHMSKCEFWLLLASLFSHPPPPTEAWPVPEIKA